MNSPAEKDHDMTRRIALLGTSAYLKTRLADILRNGEFVVDLYDSDTIPSIFDSRLHTYAVVIASADLAAGIDEDFLFNSSLVAQGFLVFDDRELEWDKEPPFLVHPGMSPEQIIAKINNIIFLNSTVRKSSRIRLNQPVEYEHEGNHCQSTVQDISENGVFIITLVPPPVGIKITMRFSLPGTREITASGRSVYTIGCNLSQSIISHPSSCDKKIVALPGVGVMFERISDADRAAIRDFIKNNR
jgi:hypothetical protein